MSNDYSELRACLSLATLMPSDPRTQQLLIDAQEAIVTLVNDRDKLRELIETAPVSTGVCMCGADMLYHGVDENHTPIDQWDYMSAKIMEE